VQENYMIKKTEKAFLKIPISIKEMDYEEIRP
jgi:hypothetical protein